MNLIELAKETKNQTLIDLATHTQSTVEQLAARVSEIAAENATLKAALAEKVAYQSAMETRVAEAVKAADPAKYEEIAKDFLTPAAEKERQGKIARLAQLEAEVLALEKSLA